MRNFFPSSPSRPLLVIETDPLITGPAPFFAVETCLVTCFDSSCVNTGNFAFFRKPPSYLSSSPSPSSSMIIRGRKRELPGSTSNRALITKRGTSTWTIFCRKFCRQFARPSCRAFVFSIVGEKGGREEGKGGGDIRMVEMDRRNLDAQS